MSSPIIFKDRAEAGKKLAELLYEFKNTNAVILAIPRGGVVIAKEVAVKLNLPLDIIVTRKIGAPLNEEYAIGAIDISGNVLFSSYEKEAVDPVWLAQKIESEKQEAVRRWTMYHKNKRPINIKGKVVIIVDDGIATGLTMHSAIAHAKREGAQNIIVAAPVGAPDSVKTLKNMAEMRILETPDYFSSVGSWYENFPQITDHEVILALAS